MTLGRSRSVEQFFKKAAKTRTFEVIVAEGGPFLDVRLMF
jgi:translation initiation factor eIF-2B subunit beta